MKVRLKEQGDVMQETSISNLRKEHFLGNNSVSFRNFNNQIINIDFQYDQYVLQCNDNSIKNFKKTLKEVKQYIKANIMK